MKIQRGDEAYFAAVSGKITPENLSVPAPLGVKSFPDLSPRGGALDTEQC